MADKAAEREPAPTGDGPIVLDQVLLEIGASNIAGDLIRRAEFGRAKYGTFLRAFNGRDPLVDLYQELLDARMYGQQANMEGKLPPELNDFLLTLTRAAEAVEELIR